jgi:hypothetical protein
LILDFEFDQHLGSHKHVINIIMWFRDMGCYTTTPLTSSLIGPRGRSLTFPTSTTTPSRTTPATRTTTRRKTASETTTEVLKDHILSMCYLKRLSLLE